jgi:hypothetical protein
MTYLLRFDAELIRDSFPVSPLEGNQLDCQSAFIFMATTLRPEVPVENY